MTSVTDYKSNDLSPSHFNSALLSFRRTSRRRR